MMRILLITTEYPPYIFGGGGSFMYNLARGLRKYGTEIYVLTRGGKHTLAQDNLPFGTLVNGKMVYVSTPDIPPRHLWFQLQCKATIEHIIRQIQPDVVHANSFSAGLLFKKLVKQYKIPRVVTIHGYPRHYLHLSMRSIKHGPNMGQIFTYVLGYPSWEWILQLELNYSSKIIAVSNFLRKCITTDYRISPTKVVYIPNGIDISDILYKTARCSNVEPNGYLLVSGGRLYYEKGHILLLYMMKKIINMGMKEVKLYIFGTGPLKALLRRKIEQLNLSKHVKLLGKLAHKDALCLIRKADIIILPSLYEIMPITLLEAIALKKPVIALKSCYLEEILNLGITIITAKNIDELTRKTSAMLNKLSDDKIKDITNRNYTILQKHFDISIIAQQYMELYKNLIAK